MGLRLLPALVGLLFAVSINAADHRPEVDYKCLEKMNDSAINLFYQAEAYFADAMSDRILNFDSVASAYCSNVDDSPLNTLVVRQSPPSLLGLLNQTRDFFAATNTPWCIVMRSDLVSQDSLSMLAQFDFAPHESGVAMVLPLVGDYLAPALEGECQNMDARLAEWIIPLKAFPSSHEKVPLTYKKCHEHASQKGKNITHLSLFDDDQVVCSVTLTWDKEWARIDDLATVPELQGRGYATKLLAHAVCFAASQSAKWCFLEASAKGLFIYKKMGFKELFQNQVFLKTNPAE